MPKISQVVDVWKDNLNKQYDVAILKSYVIRLSERKEALYLK